MAICSGYIKWSHSLFTLSFKWHSSIWKNHLVQLKKAFLSNHNMWSYALFTLLFNWHSSNCQNHLVQLKMAFLSGHNKWSYALFTLLFNPIWNRLWNLRCETGGGKFAPNDFWLWKLPKLPPNVNKMASKWIFGSLALHRHQI